MTITRNYFKLPKIKVILEYIYVLIFFLYACVNTETVDDRSPYIVSIDGNNQSGRTETEPIVLNLIDEGVKLFTITNLENEDITDKLIFEVDPEELAIVENGIVTAKKEGSGTITIRDSDQIPIQKDHTWHISVRDSKRIEITTQTGISAVLRGSTLQLSAIFYNEDNKMELTPITWESSDTSLATVDNDGLLSGKAIGQATITARAREKNNISRQKLIMVVKDAMMIATLEINLPSGTTNRLRINAELQLIPSAKNVNNDSLDISSSTLMWKSKNTDILTVDQKGVVRGIKEGRGVITVSTTQVGMSSTTIQSDPFEIEVIPATTTERIGRFVSGRGSTSGTVTLFIDTDGMLKIRLNEDFNGAGIPGPTLFLTNIQNRPSAGLRIGEINPGPGNNRVIVVTGNPDIYLYRYLIYHCEPFNIIYGTFEFDR